MKRLFQPLKGFTLVEILVGIGLIIIVFSSLFGAFILGMKIVNQSRAQVTAITLANAKIEEIRNLPYKDVGTIGGVPPGLISEIEEVTQNRINFTIKTTVIYVDDPFDGLMPEDLLSKDYKRVRVKVSWPGFIIGGKISLVTDVMPSGLETEGGGGVLFIRVLNASGQGVAGAEISLINDQVSPPIRANYETNETGIFILSGVPTSTETYKIKITKNGFNETRTYGQDEVVNPVQPHLSVFENQITEASFIIDYLTDFSIETRGRESFDDEFGTSNQLAEFENISIINNEITLATTSDNNYFLSGYLISKEISPVNLINWNRLIWKNETPEVTSIKYQLLYFVSPDWQLIPEIDLPGNSDGFNQGPVFLRNLNPVKYPSLRIKANLNTTASSVTPRLFAWYLVYNTPLLRDIPFQLQGLKMIGTDQDNKPVYKYLKEHSSGLDGRIVINNLEWDSYIFSVTTTTNMNLIETEPNPQPIDLLPGINQSVVLYFKAENNLLVEVIDASTTLPIFGANVRLFNGELGYDQAKPTDNKGQAYFLPLKETDYNLEVSYYPDYQNLTKIVNIRGSTKEIVRLEK